MLNENRKNSLERYRLKQTLNILKKRSSINGATSLISLHIPPSTQITDFINMLKLEYGTASNIKDKRTAKAVSDAIQSILARLPNYSNNKNGVIIFAGHTVEAGKMEFFIIYPPEKVGIKSYRCENRFLTEHLEEMLDFKEKIGIIAIGRGGATFAIVKGNQMDILEKRTSYVQSKHSRGGQSAQRIERGIEIQAQEFFGKMGSLANQFYLKDNQVSYLLIGGPAISKEQFLAHKTLDTRLREKVYKIYDVGYIDEQGIREILTVAQSDIDDIELIKERKLVNRFMEELAKDSEKAIYGETAVKLALELAAVDVILFSEGIVKRYFSLSCTNCNAQLTKSKEKNEIVGYEQKSKQENCENCGKASLVVTNSENLLDVLEKLALKTGATIEVIGVSHELGSQLLFAFTGIVAILRYAL